MGQALLLQMDVVLKNRKVGREVTTFFRVEGLPYGFYNDCCIFSIIQAKYAFL